MAETEPLEIVDSHCHIHEIIGSGDLTHQKWSKGGVTDVDAVVADARAAGVTRMICVGCDVDDSRLAVDFVQSRPGLWASIGIHPHEAERFNGDQPELDRFAAMATSPKVVAIGECGLDFYYNHSPKKDQLAILAFQMELALEYDLPMIFHIRDAFDDFWPVFDAHPGLRGVVHSFTADRKVLEQVLQRDLYVGLNGIMTFTKDQQQLATASTIPSDRVVIETDAPYLTPTPYRGKMCEPKHARTNLEFVANLLTSAPTSTLTSTQGERLQVFAAQTTENACRLFNLP